MEIKINKTRHNSYSVAWGNVVHEHLTWDEMLGQVACLTLTGKSFYPITTRFPKNERMEEV